MLLRGNDFSEEDRRGEMENMKYDRTRREPAGGACLARFGDGAAVVRKTINIQVHHQKAGDLTVSTLTAHV